MTRRPVPLMFIQSPSVILRTRVDEEESTSIFAKDGSSENVDQPIAEQQQVLASVKNQLRKIDSPFGRHLYKPVQVKLVNDQEIFGDIDEIENGKIMMKVEDQVIPIDVSSVIDILWRGQSIPEK